MLTIQLNNELSRTGCRVCVCGGGAFVCACMRDREYVCVCGCILLSFFRHNTALIFAFLCKFLLFNRV